MKSYSIKELLSQNLSLQEVTVNGWVKTFRSNRFIALNDGSTLNNIQCVVDLENFDEVNKIVKFTFSGYIYADPLNLASEKKFVSGSFYQKYEELLPVVFGLKNPFIVSQGFILAQ